MKSHDQSNRQLLYSARFPWFIAILFLPIAILVTYLLILKILYRYGIYVQLPFFEVKVDGNFSRPVGWVLAELLSLFFLSLWFMNQKIYYDKEKRLLEIQDRFFFLPWKRVIPVEKIAGIRVQRTARLRGSSSWEVEAIRSDRDAQLLVQAGNEERALQMAQSFSETLEKPIV